MVDEQFENAQEEFCAAIDALLANLDSPDDVHVQIINASGRASRAYRNELRRTATQDTGEDTDLHEHMADHLSMKMGFLLAQITHYRQRRGLSMPDESFDE
jgi:hypothetical protein